MLVLSRRLGDELGIGDVSVRVMELDGERVRLGVTASRHIAIYRPEQGVPLGPGWVGKGKFALPRDAFDWASLTAERFEEVIFRLISGAKGYENTQWLMKTNAPDKGRDVSTYRVHEDELAGTGRNRVVVACKHWLSQSVGVADVSLLRDQMALWGPPRVDVLVIATSGRFSTDAIQLVERHNDSDRSLKIETWADSHLERLLRRRADLLEEFGLR